MSHRPPPLPALFGEAERPRRAWRLHRRPAKLCAWGLRWWLDTWCVAVGALVARVGQALGRAHGLFGDPLVSGGSAAWGGGSRLAGAGQRVRGGSDQMAGLTGQMPTGYRVFAAGAGQALEDLAGDDAGLSAALDDAVGTDRLGRADSGAVVAGAATDTAGLAPMSGTPAGEKALIAALRSRVVQQQRVVTASRVRDAQLAGMLRCLGYARRGGAGAAMPAGGGIPWGAGGLTGGLPIGAGMASRLSGLTGRAGRPRHPRSALASRTDHRGGRVPASAAAAIELSQVSYVAMGAAGAPGAARRVIGAALDARGVRDPAARRAWTEGYLTLITRESTFQPNAVNTTDANNRGPVVADGHRLGCSRGLAQMTPGAFAAHHQPGTSTNIYDPLANIAASMNRMLTVYGVRADGSDLAAKVTQTDPRRAAHGY